MVPDEISSEKRRENCVCACFRESVHEPSVAIWRKSDVDRRRSLNAIENVVWVCSRVSGFSLIVFLRDAFVCARSCTSDQLCRVQKYTSVPTGNLDQRWGHGIWVGKAPMTNTSTENGVQKARSLHRVPPEERFVISELKKVRGLPWNGRAENLKATIVTQQDQGPSGDRRVYFTTRVVARHGATPNCSGCVGLGPHAEACRVRLEKALADERADSVETPVGRITEPATESQESAPAAQQEPACSSSRPAAPMPTQNFQNEQMDSPMELGPQERRERKGARPSETPTSEFSGRPVVKARPASPQMIVPTAEGSGTVCSCVIQQG